MESFSTEQLYSLPDIDTQVFLYMMKACGEGVKLPDSSIVSHISSAIDNICTFVFKQTLINRPKPHYLVQKFSDYPNVLVFLLQSFMEICIFEDNAVQWSLSRSLLPLILLQRPVMIFL